jgi:hypothetical protein
MLVKVLVLVMQNDKLLVHSMTCGLMKSRKALDSQRSIME